MNKSEPSPTLKQEPPSYTNASKKGDYIGGALLVIVGLGLITVIAGDGICHLSSHSVKWLEISNNTETAIGCIVGGGVGGGVVCLLGLYYVMRVPKLIPILKTQLQPDPSFDKTTSEKESEEEEVERRSKNPHLYLKIDNKEIAVYHTTLEEVQKLLPDITLEAGYYYDFREENKNISIIRNNNGRYEIITVLNRKELFEITKRWSKEGFKTEASRGDYHLNPDSKEQVTHKLKFLHELECREHITPEFHQFLEGLDLKDSKLKEEECWVFFELNSQIVTIRRFGKYFLGVEGLTRENLYNLRFDVNYLEQNWSFVKNKNLLDSQIPKGHPFKLLRDPPDVGKKFLGLNPGSP